MDTELCMTKTKFKAKKKGIKFIKDAIVCLRGFLLPQDKGKRGDRFVAFLRSSEVKRIGLQDLKRRKKYAKK